MKKFILAAFVALSVAFGTGGVAMAGTPTQSAKDQACEGISGTVGGQCNGGGNAELSNVIAEILNILSWVAGIAAVIMIIIAGLRYITSGGDSSSVASAKSTLIYAVVGIIIVALAQFIVKFVLGQTT